MPAVSLQLFFCTYDIFQRCQIVVYAAGKKNPPGPPVKLGETEWNGLMEPLPPSAPDSAKFVKFTVPVPAQYMFETAQKLILCVVFEQPPPSCQPFWETKIKLGKLVKLASIQSRPGVPPQFLKLYQHVDGPLPMVQFTKPSGKVIMVKQYPAMAPGQLLVSALDLTKRIPPPGITFIPPMDVLAIKDVYQNPHWQVDCSTIVQVKAQDLIAADSGGTSDPYFVWKTPSGAVVMKSKYIKKTLNPVWKPFEVQNTSGVDGGMLHLFDHDTLKDDPLGISHFPFTASDFQNLAPGGRMERCHPVQHPKRGSSSAAGNVTVSATKHILSRRLMASHVEPMLSHPLVTNSDTSYLKILPTSTFLQALGCGMKMIPWMVLDMTGSNGSMHDIGEHPNPYETCITAVGKVLKSYTSDNIFNLYGYGGAIDTNFPPFFEMGKSDGACKKGVKGVLKAYHKVRPRIRLGDMGSANGGDMAWRAQDHRYFCDDFYQVINHACDVMEAKIQNIPINQMPPEYMILCFFIDGDGFRIPATNRAIIRASALPISIVLVGVGNSRFDNLSKFDADASSPVIKTDGKTVKAARDVVQFVKFNECVIGGKLKKKRLRAELLAEIPTQVESYLGLYGVRLI